MAEIVQARVWQKVDTYNNWMANDLILGKGEMALVVGNGGIPLNMRWGDGTKAFRDLTNAIAYDQGQFVAVVGNTLPSVTGVGYTILGSGTYTQSGKPNVVVPVGKLGVLVSEGGTWSLQSEVELPEYNLLGDITLTSNKTIIDYTSYVSNGIILTDGSKTSSADDKCVYKLPYSISFGNSIIVEGLQFGAVSKNIVMINSSGSVLFNSVITSSANKFNIPPATSHISFTIKSNAGEVYSNVKAYYFNSVDEDSILKILDYNLNAKFLTNDNEVPTPTINSNAVPLGFANLEYLKNSSVESPMFKFSENIDVFYNKYVNNTGFVHDEEGSVYVEIPYSVGSNIIYEGVESIDGVDVSGEYLFDRVWLEASGNRFGNLLVNGGSLSNQPFNIFTSNSNLVKLRINIYREQQEGKFNFNKLNIRNLQSGEVYVSGLNNITLINGKEIYPSTKFIEESDLKNENKFLQKTNQIGRNVNIRRATTTNNRFDHGMVRRCKNGDLIAVSSIFDSSGADLAPSKLTVSVSKDNGGSWSQLNIKPFNTTYSDTVAESNPDIIQKDNGDFVVFYSVKTDSNGDNRALAYSVLTNNGNTWGEAVFVTGFDRTAPGSSGGWKMRTGEILVPIYRLVSGNTSTDAVSVGGMLKSTDGGNTFVNMNLELYDTEFTTEPSKSVFEPFVYETSLNTLIYGYRTLKGYCRARKSTDKGLTWGNSFNLFESANSMSSVKRMSFYDNKLDFIYVAVHNRIKGAITDHRTDRRYMNISVSTDGESFKETDALVYNYNGTKIAFEPNIFDDLSTNNIYVAWSADVNGIDLYCNIIDKNNLIKLLK